MKITIEIYDEKYSVEIPDDSDSDKFFRSLDSLLRTVWNEEQVEKYLK